MLAMKKKIFGYDKEQVDFAMQNLNDEIFKLRQELFTMAKNESSAPVADEAKDSQIAVLTEETGELKDQLRQKNVELERIKNQLNAQLSVALNTSETVDYSAFQKELEQYQQAIMVKNEEIDSLKKALAAVQDEQRTNIASFVKKNSPDLRMIEKVYLRAFAGAKDVAKDAKYSMINLTDRVYNELGGDIKNTAGMYEDLIRNKNAFSLFITQGIMHLKTLEQLIGAISDIDFKTSEYLGELDASRDRILQDLNDSVSAFDVELEDSFSLDSEKPVNVTKQMNTNDLSEYAAPASAYEEQLVPVCEEPTPAVADEDPAPVAYDDPTPVFGGTNSSKSEHVSQAVVTPFPMHSEDVLGENDDDDISYDPEEELKDMKEAIKREIQESKQDNLAPVDEEKSIPLDKVVPDDDEANAKRKTKVNIQDILKKHSNISMNV